MKTAARRGRRAATTAQAEAEARRAGVVADDRAAGARAVSRYAFGVLDDPLERFDESTREILEGAAHRKHAAAALHARFAAAVDRGALPDPRSLTLLWPSVLVEQSRELLHDDPHHPLGGRVAYYFRDRDEAAEFAATHGGAAPHDVTYGRAVWRVHIPLPPEEG